jgi:NAD(P)H-nitrite reductase large subunit
MLESVMQADYDGNYYKRLFFHEHLLVGGVLIGAATKARAPLLQVVKERREIPYSEREALLDLGPAAGARDEEEDEVAV